MQQKRKKRSTSSIILIVFIIIFVIGGIALIAYPLITDIPVNIGKGSRIADWQLMKDSTVSKIQENENAVTETTMVQSATTETELQTEATGSTTQITADSNKTQQQEETLPATAPNSDSDSDKPVRYAAEDIFPAKITIPKIDVEWIVNEGADVPTLKKGPGHIPETPLPGEEGRFTISGHRTTYGAPFNRIDELEGGDLIYVETLNGIMYVYRVTSFQVLKPTYVQILVGTDKKELLLTTCYPEYSSRERLVVVAEQATIFPFDLNLR